MKQNWSDRYFCKVPFVSVCAFEQNLSIFRTAIVSSLVQVKSLVHRSGPCWHLRYFPRRIKQTNYFLKTLFIKEPSCSFEGGETTEY